MSNVNEVKPDEKDGVSWDALAGAPSPEAVAAAPIEVDPEDPTQFSLYTVQEEYVDRDGNTVAAGTEVPAVCKNCALWETPLPGTDTPLCRPGAVVDVDRGDGKPFTHTMRADLYSCQRHFVPLDMAKVLELVGDDPYRLRALSWAFPVIKQLVKYQQRVAGMYAKKNLPGMDDTLDVAYDFMFMFTSGAQIEFVHPYVKARHNSIRTAKTKRTQNAPKAGYLVEWDGSNGKRVKGVVQSYGGPKSAIVVSVFGDEVQKLDPEATAEAVRWQRPIKEWKTLNPKIISKLDS